LERRTGTRSRRTTGPQRGKALVSTRVKRREQTKWNNGRLRAVTQSANAPVCKTCKTACEQLPPPMHIARTTPQFLNAPVLNGCKTQMNNELHSFRHENDPHQNVGVTVPQVSHRSSRGKRQSDPLLHSDYKHSKLCHEKSANARILASRRGEGGVQLQCKKSRRNQCQPRRQPMITRTVQTTCRYMCSSACKTTNKSWNTRRTAGRQPTQ
jgi:hypothetical protein